jgi:hypothetical protein
MTNETSIFGFELDFAGTLHCIPMCVRLKLDSCGVKLSLKQWNRLPKDVRLRLVEMPCGSSEQADIYRNELVNVIGCHTGLSAEFIAVPIAAEWSDRNNVPSRITSYAAALGVRPPSNEQWAQLKPLQRFALFKLTRPNHDNDNFLPALREFGLA